MGYGVAMVMTELDERFDRGTLDPGVWFPWYLPHWGGAGAAATWQVDRDGLRLSIPPDQGLWCPDVHDEPLRVSCIQSAHLDGQQPFRDGLTVADPRPEFRGYTPRYGRIEVRMRATISHRSMFAFWLSGIEDQPERSGEICVAEIFGTATGDGTAGVGMGVHAFRDPALREDFATVPLALDVAQHHTYGVDWRPGSARVRRRRQGRAARRAGSRLPGAAHARRVRLPGPRHPGRHRRPRAGDGRRPRPRVGRLIGTAVRR